MRTVGAKILIISNCNFSTEKTNLVRLVITTLHTVRYMVNCTTGPWKPQCFFPKLYIRKVSELL